MAAVGQTAWSTAVPLQHVAGTKKKTCYVVNMLLYICKTHLSRREFNTRLVFALFVQDGNVKTFFLVFTLKNTTVVVTEFSEKWERSLKWEPSVISRTMWCIRDTTVLLTCCVKEWRAERVSTVCAFILSQCTHSSRRTFFNQITTWLGGKSRTNNWYVLVSYI